MCTMQSNEANDRAQLTYLVEKLTTTGSLTLDTSQLKKLKTICRKSDDYVEHVFHTLMACLRKHHAEVRLSAFQICEELFMRSHCFRNLLLSELQNFVHLVMAIDGKYPLPPPKKAAMELQRISKRALKNWQEKFGKTYKKLSLCYNYLQTSKQVDFSNVETDQIQRMREQERVERQRNISLQRLNSAIKDLDDIARDVRSSITEAENCINLLLQSCDYFQSDFTSPATLDGSSSQPAVSNGRSNRDCRALANAVADSSRANESLSSDEVAEKLETSANLTRSSRRNVSDGTATRDDGCASRSPTDSSCPSVSDDVVENLYQNDEASCRPHGLHQHTKPLSINIRKHVTVEATEDNADLIRDLRDQFALLSNRFIPAIKHCLEVMTKCCGSQSQIKMGLDLKLEVETALSKIRKLNVVSNASDMKTDTCSDEDTSDDEDFIEVPTSDEQSRLSEGDFGDPRNLLSGTDVNGVPSIYVCNKGEPSSTAVKKGIGGTSTQTATSDSSDGRSPGSFDFLTACSSSDDQSSSAHCSSDAPVVPFGSDLCSWGENIDTPIVHRNNSDSSWWSRSADGESVDVVAAQARKSRVINFVGSFEPVKWKCRAPLPNGSLCERMDRYKCPFHGKIVARDKVTGVIRDCGQQQLDAAPSAPASSQAPPAGNANYWEDVELQQDIEAATGINLVRNRTSKGKSKVKKSESGLTDIRQASNSNPRKRLAAVIFHRTTMRRVAEAMDDIDHQRRQKKFANNFNYTFRS